MMKEELAKLLSYYANQTLRPYQRQRLIELLNTPEGRDIALRSNAPEAVFLAEDEHISARSVDIDWDKFSHRLEQQGRRREHKYTSHRIVAAAAIIVLAVILGLFWINTLDDKAADSFAEGSEPDHLEYMLKHRRIPDVMNMLNTVLSSERKIVTDFQTNTIKIVDEPEKLAAAKRLLILLDNPPLKLEARLEMWDTHNSSETSRNLVANNKTRQTDTSSYDIFEEHTFNIETGNQIQTTIGGRWRLTGLLSPDEDGLSLYIHNLLIYDLQFKKIVGQLRDQKILPDQRFMISETIVDHQGLPSVITITLGQE